MRRRWVVVVALASIILLGAAAYFGVTYFAPRPSTRADEAAIEGTTLRSGSFHDGLPGHHASGDVRLVRASDGALVLRFESYEATPGPDVYFYLTPKERADSTADVEGAGLRLAVPGGAADGQATLRGDFNVPLPAGADASRYAGVSVWCERFDAFFGYAVLASP